MPGSCPGTGRDRRKRGRAPGRARRARQPREQSSELALKDLASAEEFVRNLANDVYVAGDQLFRTIATRVAERVAEGLAIGKACCVRLRT